MPELAHITSTDDRRGHTRRSTEYRNRAIDINNQRAEIAQKAIKQLRDGEDRDAVIQTLLPNLALHADYLHTIRLYYTELLGEIDRLRDVA